MSDFKWRRVFALLATQEPPLQVWIKWVGSDTNEPIETPRTVDERGATFGDLGWRPYIAIEELFLRAYVERPRGSKQSRYQAIESLRDALKSLGKLPLESAAGGGFRITGHLPAVAPALSDEDCDGLPTPFDAFARALFSAYPDWRGHARLNEVHGGQCLWVEVPPPPEADMNGPLWISTAGGEVTVGIDYSHSHFDWPPDAYDDVLEHIRDLLSERLSVHGQFIGEWLSSAGTGPAERTIRVGELRVSRLRVRSWHGMHNRDETFA
ncbi:hypothetical protein DMC25_21770 [Caulobacter sp. D4A]|uniref:hypothetical protein n=1 Tax=unclassified Caulobacter TaxID=2648921 RepID=UPI000D7362F1|nr:MULTISPECIES: hypothetical protein [unclassified Caulobacter]PXA79384.1 hypothetical protein DMC25_21770 [Caulobacter sp. D4A]PXA90504.1 hypothetical protein DMC18_14515 [Caulobacter sp. D5]